MSNVQSVHIAGDQGGEGHQTRFDMTSGAHAKVQLVYAGRYARPFASLTIDCEVYQAPDGMLSVHTICPKCANYAMVKASAKKIALEGDRLFIEPFTCKFLVAESRRQDMQAEGGERCGFRCAYDGKVIKDA